MDERDQTVISTGAGHDARGRENHEFWPPLHHAIQQRGKRPHVAMKNRTYAHYPSCKYTQKNGKSQLEWTSLDYRYCFLSSIERDVVNRRCMIGTLAVHHLSCLSIGTQNIIGRLRSAPGDWGEKGYGDCSWRLEDVTCP